MTIGAGGEKIDKAAEILLEKETEQSGEGDHPGTIAGRAAALGVPIKEIEDEESTGSPGADADREQAEQAAKR